MCNPKDELKNFGSAVGGAFVDANKATIIDPAKNSNLDILKNSKKAAVNLFGRPQTAEEKQLEATTAADQARANTENNATITANQQLLANARRRRTQQGLLGGDAPNVLSSSA